MSASTSSIIKATCVYEQNFKVKTIKTELVKMGQPEVVRRKRVMNTHQEDMAYKRRKGTPACLKWENTQTRTGEAGMG